MQLHYICTTCFNNHAVGTSERLLAYIILTQTVRRSWIVKRSETLAVYDLQFWVYLLSYGHVLWCCWLGWNCNDESEWCLLPKHFDTRLRTPRRLAQGATNVYDNHLTPQLYNTIGLKNLILEGGQTFVVMDIQKHVL